jgi:hypothetical protein
MYLLQSLPVSCAGVGILDARIFMIYLIIPYRFYKVFCLHGSLLTSLGLI